MNITVENISAVDKKIIVEADQSDIGPRIEKSLREYRKKMTVPGFRPGMAPMGLVKKRIGQEVEQEQVDEYIQEIFRTEIFPKHNPVGEPKVISNTYEDGKLRLEFEIGVKPEYELADLKSIGVDKLVHDVTDEEVEKEYQANLRRSGEWSETEEAATETDRVTVDVVMLDAEGNETEDADKDLVLDFDREENAEYKAQLTGKKAGEETVLNLKEADDKTVQYKAVIKKVERYSLPELNEEFFRNGSRGEASNEEEFRSFLKSQIQNYFDSTADDLLRDKIATALIKAHDFEVPSAIYNDVLNSRIDRERDEETKELPADFDRAAFEEENKENIIDEARWSFIVSDLLEKYPDTEIAAEDVDAFFQAEAAKMGLPAEMLKNFYASQSGYLEQLRMRIRTDKLFTKLVDEVSVNELSKEAYEEKYANKK